MNVKLVISIIGAVGLVVAAMVTAIGPKVVQSVDGAEIHFTVIALDSETTSGIDQAQISVNVGSSAQTETADSTGKYTFAFDKSQAKKQAMVRITKPGFRASTKQVDLPPLDGSVTIRLDKLAQAPPTIAATEPIPSRQTEISPHISGALPPPSVSNGSATPAQPKVYVDIKPKTSGEKLSGSMKAFSDWYDLCSDPLPEGAVIESNQFVLSGDRSCGTYAVCEATLVTPQKVCHRFKLQGHDEWPHPGQAKSEGILSVTAFKMVR